MKESKKKIEQPSEIPLRVRDVLIFMIVTLLLIILIPIVFNWFGFYDRPEAASDVKKVAQEYDNANYFGFRQDEVFQLSWPVDSDELIELTDVHFFYFNFVARDIMSAPNRVTNQDYHPHQYMPFNYTLTIGLRDGTEIHAHLPNVRLVTGDSGEVVFRYMELEADSKEFYIEINTTPEIFELGTDPEFFVNMDDYHIIYLQQYLSDTYLDMRG